MRSYVGAQIIATFGGYLRLGICGAAPDQPAAGGVDGKRGQS